MNITTLASAADELSILRIFFQTISAMELCDNTISDSRIVKDAQKQLKIALRGVSQKCTCSKRTWGGVCETCQGSSKELVELRNFFRVIRDAKKYTMTSEQIQQFIDNTKERCAQ